MSISRYAVLQIRTLTAQTEVLVTQSNIADGTVQITLLSVSNADSTLQIVKERQPIVRSDSKTASRRPLVSPLVFIMKNGSEKFLVEVNGIEPMTPCLQSRCSPS
jgi:hypothetical protein